MKPLKFILASILSVFCLAGCIGEDTSMCYGIRLQFEFPDHSRPPNEGAVFVFKANTDSLVDVFHLNNSQLQPGKRTICFLPSGEYSMVFWGGVDDVNYNYKRLSSTKSIFNSTKENLYVALATEDVPQHETSSILADLFHQEMKNISIPDKGAPLVYFDKIVKNTNTIKIDIVEKPEGSEIFDLEARVVARNWQYDFTNEILNTTTKIIYSPYTSELNEFVKKMEVSTLRLVPGRNQMLHIEEKTTGRIILSRKLVDLIMATGIYTESDLDDLDTFHIEIFFQDRVIIKVNGWLVSDSGQDIT